MRRLNNIFKIILESTLIFFIFFIWLNFYLDSTILSSVISFIMTGVIEGILQFFRSKKKDKSSIKEKEKMEAEKMFISLTNGNQLSFFERLFSLRYKNISKQKDFLVLSKDDEKIVVFPLLKYQKLSGDDLLFVIKKTSRICPTKIVIVCGESEKQALDLAKSSKTQIIILDKYQTYLSLYKEYDFYPEVKNITLPRPTFKNFLSSFFSQSHARGFIISAIFLMLGSFFTKMNLYYLISTSILILFGIICLFNKKEKPQDFSI